MFANEYTATPIADSLAGDCSVAVADAWQRMAPGFGTMTSTDLCTDYPVHCWYKRSGFTSVNLGTDYDRLVHDLDL